VGTSNEVAMVTKRLQKHTPIVHGRHCLFMYPIKSKIFSQWLCKLGWGMEQALYFRQTGGCMGSGLQILHQDYLLSSLRGGSINALSRRPSQQGNGFQTFKVPYMWGSS
jgi:hypothetical protein